MYSIIQIFPARKLPGLEISVSIFNKHLWKEKKMSTLYKLFQNLQGDMLPELVFMRPNPRIIKKQLAGQSHLWTKNEGVRKLNLEMSDFFLKGKKKGIACWVIPTMQVLLSLWGKKNQWNSSC